MKLLRKFSSSIHNNIKLLRGRVCIWNIFWNRNPHRIVTVFVTILWEKYWRSGIAGPQTPLHTPHQKTRPIVSIRTFPPHQLLSDVLTGMPTNLLSRRVSDKGALKLATLYRNGHLSRNVISRPARMLGAFSWCFWVTNRYLS